MLSSAGKGKMKTAHLVVVSLLLTVIATTNADSLSVPLKNYQESVVFTFAILP